MTRFLGLDHGARRIGVAVADDDSGIAFARPALRVAGTAAALEAAAALATAEGVATIVVGLPRNMDGSEGPQAAAARAFGEALAQTIRARSGDEPSIQVEVVFVDERLTSWAAGREVSVRDRRSRRGGELDSAAARLILQDYLDARRAHGPSTVAGMGRDEPSGGEPASDGRDGQEVG